MRPTQSACSRWLGGLVLYDTRSAARSAAPPLFLCPAIRHLSRASSWPRRPAASPPGRHSLGYLQSHSRLHSSALALAQTEVSIPVQPEQGPVKSLPTQCPGCGAFSQTENPQAPGFFDTARSSTRRYLGLPEDRHKPRVRPEDQVVHTTLQAVDQDALRKLGVDLSSLLPETATSQTSGAEDTASILCSRCHDLVHHRAGTSIYHPSIGSIRETLDESPYKFNHVFHVLDAADFPMSLLPRIHEFLSAMPLRSHNRRARKGRFYHGRKTELSFIITRSDLLAPGKDQVDRLMPWITQTLRDALGRAGRNVRLGNIRCVSAKRGWWTKELREEIWQRGGAAWMVGKANVGKSYLFQSVFPKGRMHNAAHNVSALPTTEPEAPVEGSTMPTTESDGPWARDEDDTDEFALLPPPQRETNYPQMPIVSALPGTTASPIRIPFGNGKGELIDLPGLSRSGLEAHVDIQHQHSLVMTSRAQPEQEVLKGPSQSLLLGGFIRLTPRTPDLVFLAYNFTPLREHRTLTEKAISIQAQTSTMQIENISRAGTGQKIKLAASVELKFDVTKQRAGPITRRDAANIKVERLPYRVLAVDILIEGCGWVEVVAQVRAKDLYERRHPETPGPELLQSLDLSSPPVGETGAPAESGETNWPVIDVYSPEGRFIGSRRPLNAWLMCQPRKSASSRSRPRKSMQGAKTRAKTAAREGSSARGQGTTND